MSGSSPDSIFLIRYFLENPGLFVSELTSYLSFYVLAFAKCYFVNIPANFF